MRSSRLQWAWILLAGMSATKLGLPAGDEVPHDAGALARSPLRRIGLLMPAATRVAPSGCVARSRESGSS
jgi:hypothetical protein